VLRIDFARNLYSRNLDARDSRDRDRQGYAWSIGWTR
jgi:hypothetical protein